MIWSILLLFSIDIWSTFFQNLFPCIRFEQKSFKSLSEILQSFSLSSTSSYGHRAEEILLAMVMTSLLFSEEMKSLREESATNSGWQIFHESLETPHSLCNTSNTVVNGHASCQMFCHQLRSMACQPFEKFRPKTKLCSNG